MKTLMSSVAPQGIWRLQTSEKELVVFVALDALTQMESGRPQECGVQSRPCETAMSLSAWSATTPLILRTSTLASPAPSQNHNLEEPGTEPLLALREDPDALAITTKDRVEHLLALTHKIRNRVGCGVAGPSSIDAQYNVGQGAGGLIPSRIAFR